jgi:hypothetical protein
MACEICGLALDEEATSSLRHPLSCQWSYAEVTVILREGYGRNSASRARMTMPDIGVADYGEFEVQMNESTGE